MIFLLLEKCKDLCHAHKADFLVANIDPLKKDYLAQSCRGLSIPYLDISGELSRASRPKPLKFDIDPHYNQFAHRVIGECLSEYIKAKYDLIKKERL